MEILDDSLHMIEHLMDDGYFEEALEELKALSNDYPDSYLVLSLLGECHLCIGEPDKAIKPLRRSTRIFPHKKSGKRGNHHERRLIGALRKRSEKQEPFGVWVDHFLLGCSYARCHQFRRATKHLDQANDMMPNDTEVIRNLGWVNCMQENTGIGRALLLRAIALEPRNALAYHDLGADYLFAQDLKNARMYLDKAIELDPDDSFIQETVDQLEDMEAKSILFKRSHDKSSV
ncbi:MAG: hypothetical protein Q8P95_00235 [bacterium]|nr:hypothetical protein [bacterium]